MKWLGYTVVVALAVWAPGSAGVAANAGVTRLVPAAYSVAAPSPTTIPRVVFLGDSLTAGYGLDAMDAYPALLQVRMRAAGYRYEVVNAGVSGDTSAGGLRRVDRALDGDVAVLVVALGGNDALRGLPPAELKKNLAEIIVRGRAKGATVLLAGMEAPPNFGPTYTSEFRGVFRQLAGEYHVPLVPFLLAGVAGIPELNIRDGIHPNPKGARIVEATVWRALEPLLHRTAR